LTNVNSELYTYVIDTELQLSGKKSLKIPNGQSEQYKYQNIVYFWVFQSNVFILMLRRTSHLNQCSYLEIRCFKSGSMNKCSQSLHITVLSNTHGKIMRTVICIPIQSHQSSQARSTTWRTSNGCNYDSVFSVLQLTM
jgi:hypothetical protein